MRLDAATNAPARAERADVHQERRAEFRLVVVRVGDERALQALVRKKPVEREREGDCRDPELPALQDHEVVDAFVQALRDLLDEVALRAEPVQWSLTELLGVNF